MTVRDLVDFAAENGDPVWSVCGLVNSRVEFRWQAEEADTPALLNAMETAFGVRWPKGRVAVQSSYHDRQWNVCGVIDPGDGSEAPVVFTMFERQTSAPVPEPRRREV